MQAPPTQAPDHVFALFKVVPISPNGRKNTNP